MRGPFLYDAAGRDSLEGVEAVQAQRNLIGHLLAAELRLKDWLPGLIQARQLVPEIAVFHELHCQYCVALQQRLPWSMRCTFRLDKPIAFDLASGPTGYRSP